MLPDADTFASRASALGLDDETTIISYTRLVNTPPPASGGPAAPSVMMPSLFSMVGFRNGSMKGGRSRVAQPVRAKVFLMLASIRISWPMRTTC